MTAIITDSFQKRNTSHIKFLFVGVKKALWQADVRFWHLRPVKLRQQFPGRSGRRRRMKARKIRQFPQ